MGIVIEAKPVDAGAVSVKPKGVAPGKAVFLEVVPQGVIVRNPSKQKVVSEEATLVEEAGAVSSLRVETVMFLAGIDVHEARVRQSLADCPGCEAAGPAGIREHGDERGVAFVQVGEPHAVAPAQEAGNQRFVEDREPGDGGIALGEGLRKDDKLGNEGRIGEALLQPDWK